MKKLDVTTVDIFPKLAGEWEGKYEVLLTDEETDYVRSLESKYSMFHHLTKCFGMSLGCLAAKRMVAITESGDVLPCIWMYWSLGNIFDEPLDDILKRGMKYFSEYTNKCLVSSDRNFIEKYVTKTYGKKLPVPIAEVMGNV